MNVLPPIRPNDHWHTPQSLLEILREFYGGPIPLDPASDSSNPCGALRFYTPEDNGLILPWDDDWFVNWPYSNNVAWVKKAVAEAPGKKGIALAPTAIADNKNTRWFAHRARACSRLGRVKFIASDSLIKAREKEGKEGRPNSPMQDVSLYCFGEDSLRFSRILAKAGFPTWTPFQETSGLHTAA